MMMMMAMTMTVMTDDDEDDEDDDDGDGVSGGSSDEGGEPLTSLLSGKAKIAQILREFLTFMYSQRMRSVGKPLFEMCCPSFRDWVGMV